TYRGANSGTCALRRGSNDLKGHSPRSRRPDTRQPERAFALASAHELNIYDASIVAAALESGCDAVLSEDMQHGQKFAALRIENPFR
ncbi:MAG: PIN domain-containing protein, partial [bacterium]